MSVPKTIYVHKNICNVVENGELSSTARIDRRWPQDIEYRLVDPNEQSNTELTGEYHADCNKLIKDLANEQSKIERIRAEIEDYRLAYRDRVKVAQTEGMNNHEMIFIGSATACTNALEIIDRISNESDVSDNGGDS